MDGNVPSTTSTPSINSKQALSLPNGAGLTMAKWAGCQDKNRWLWGCPKFSMTRLGGQGGREAAIASLAQITNKITLKLRNALGNSLILLLHASSLPFIKK